MQDIRVRIAESLLETGSIQVYKERPFVFVSGRISPVYIDCRRLLSFPQVRDEIIEELARKAERDIHMEAIDVVAGGETAGIPYAAFVSYRLRKPMIYVRKNPKGYGQTKQIEGILEPGQRVMLVEDLITDGMSKLRFNIGIRAEGARITHCLCIFEYGSDRLNLHEGKDKLAEHNIELHTLVNWDDVLSTGIAKQYITGRASEQIWDFLKSPETWGRRMGFE
jgi:orotate phosphoribosyltransferase